MTLIEELKAELAKLQQAQEECVDEFGMVKPESKYKYKMLVTQAHDFKSCIEWLTENLAK